jgi:hypothetical protein
MGELAVAAMARKRTRAQVQTPYKTRGRRLTGDACQPELAWLHRNKELPLGLVDPGVASVRLSQTRPQDTDRWITDGPGVVGVAL